MAITLSLTEFVFFLLQMAPSIMAVGLRMRKTKFWTQNDTYWYIHALHYFFYPIGGLFMFVFLERETNYQFVHSAWHVSMALAILFLLPRSPLGDPGKGPSLNGFQFLGYFCPSRQKNWRALGGHL